MSKLRLQQKMAAFIAGASATDALNPLMMYGRGDPRLVIPTVSSDKKAAKIKKAKRKQQRRSRKNNRK
ncbi:MAG: hypothetical protein IBX57_00440 [Gammaproteobacteria bacterium]|nr:hypothetical protein [Gammaproteobacteria bacterium]